MASSYGGSDSAAPSATVTQTYTLADRIKALYKFLFDEKEDEIVIMGRTPSSWGKVGLFYVIFYICLGGFFAVTLAVFYQTVDWDYPKLQGSDSVLNMNPGLGFRPLPDVKTPLIRFVKGKPATYKVYTDHLKGFLDYYENAQQIGDNFMECGNIRQYRQKLNWEKVCKFDLSRDIEAGSDRHPCIKSDDYGYDDGTPCIVLKLNKIYGWLPEPYENATVPPVIRDAYNPNYVKVHCAGEQLADTENIGNIDYYPDNGFHFKFFPYLNQQGYRQPIVFAHFSNITNGVVVFVRCKAYAKNIRHNKIEVAGSVHFELLID